MLILILALCLTRFHHDKAASAYIAGVAIMLEVLFVDMPIIAWLLS